MYQRTPLVGFAEKVMLVLALLSVASCASNPYYDPEKKHHTPEGFRNVHPHEEHGFSDMLQWSLNAPENPNAGIQASDFPMAKPAPGVLPGDLLSTAALGEGGARLPVRAATPSRVTWIGHATALIELDGLRILTDPFFSDRASPFTWIGPERLVDPAVAIEDLPPIDVVLISHDHYDHMDEASIRALRNRAGGERTRFIVPLANASLLNDRGIENVHELDWWESTDHRGVEFTAVPVQHWSKRSLSDGKSRLWSGWVARGKRKQVFFAGDTGYSPHFKEIGRRMGPFDLALIPIGAYEPRWFMKPYHVNPEEAVQIHLDTRSRSSVGIHWGTIPLTDEPLTEPPKALERAKQEAGQGTQTFRVLRHGESLEF